MKNLSWLLVVVLCLGTSIDASAQEAKEAKNQITKEAKQAIDAGLAYLVKQQNQDGSWGTGQYTGNIAVTSLAGLAVLSGGHKADGKPHGAVITKAVQYILSQEDKDTGFLHTPRGASHGPMYAHAFGVLFLADATGAITDKKLQNQVQQTLTRSVALIVKSQNQQGGWRYQPRPADADVTATACQVVALRAARDVGVGVPKATLDKAIDYIKSCQDGQGAGGFRYQSMGGTPGFPRSAAAVTALQRLGVREGDSLKKGLDYVRARRPGAKGAELDPTFIHYDYAYYYAAKAMWYAGDKEWQKWYPAIRDDLLRAGRKDDGSWSHGPICPHYSTAMTLIVLQMPNGALPSLKR